MNRPQPYWSALIAGIGLGLTLLGTFLVTGHGSGASGFFTRLTAWLNSLVAISMTQANGYFEPYLGSGTSPLDSWISWQVAGMAIGALAGSLPSRRFQAGVERGARTSVGMRLVYAFAGGVLAGFGAALARGCTSWVGLSGGATLAVAGFVFLIAFFATGLLVSAVCRRIWQ